MKPTLFVLAAGMGSRYGGLKQLDGIGPHGETIMDYSIYDAIKAGFGKVVFVIRHDFEKDFYDQVLSRYKGHIPMEVVFQSVDKLPKGYKCPENRTRPWGTNHALLMGETVIKEPFAVLNADDYYGPNALKVIADFLSEADTMTTGNYCMVGFQVGKTMTENGSVSRGVCTVDAKGLLRRVIERRKIFYEENGSISYLDEDNKTHHSLDAATPVSMNLWGFTPDYFDFSNREFKRFLNKYIGDPDREFFIPSVIDKLIGNREATVTVLDTDSQWFGVTYSKDRDNVCANLKALHDNGTYPESLFD